MISCGRRENKLSSLSTPWLHRRGVQRQTTTGFHLRERHPRICIRADTCSFWNLVLASETVRPVRVHTSFQLDVSAMCNLSSRPRPSSASAWPLLTSLTAHDDALTFITLVCGGLWWHSHDAADIPKREGGDDADDDDDGGGGDFAEILVTVWTTTVKRAALRCWLLKLQLYESH